MRLSVCVFVFMPYGVRARVVGVALRFPNFRFCVFVCITSDVDAVCTRVVRMAYGFELSSLYYIIIIIQYSECLFVVTSVAVTMCNAYISIWHIRTQTHATAFRWAIFHFHNKHANSTTKLKLDQSSENHYRWNQILANDKKCFSFTQNHNENCTLYIHTWKQH